MFGALFLSVCFLIWIIPIILVAKSNRTQGSEKLAWIFYLLLAPLKQKPADPNIH